MRKITPDPPTTSPKLDDSKRSLFFNELGYDQLFFAIQHFCCSTNGCLLSNNAATKARCLTHAWDML